MFKDILDILFSLVQLAFHKGRESAKEPNDEDAEAAFWQWWESERPEFSVPESEGGEDADTEVEG